MKISTQWLKNEWLKNAGVSPSVLADLSADKIAEILTFRGLEVEEVQDLSEGFQNVVSAKILERNPHPNADRLSLCKVQNDEGIFDVVCGAQNMKAGDIVGMAKIGACLPNGLKIEKSKIRGVESSGMLCSEEELKLADESEGILILPSTTPVGRPLAEILGRSDVLLNLKITANRGDCLSYQGLARELLSALKVPFSVPGLIEEKTIEKNSKTPSRFHVELKAGLDAPQFAVIEISGVKVIPSSEEVRQKLESAGMRSINNIVDATNLVMLELGHPVHAYDVDCLHGQVIGVRNSIAGEKLKLLDETDILLSGEELVVFDGRGAVGLAGVMGGAETEVTEKTTHLLLECAEFSASRVRKTATRYHKKSEASHRFERGVDPSQLQAVLNRLYQLIAESLKNVPNVKLKLEGSVYAKVDSEILKRKSIPFDFHQMNQFLGADFSEKAANEALTSLGFQIQEAKVSVPFFRRDVSIVEDLYEEVARVLGYDQIPETLPALRSSPTSRREDKDAARLAMVARIQDQMSVLGFNETVHFAFTSTELLKKAGLSSELKLLNPLSEDQSTLVPSLMPGLLQNAQDNQNHHFGSEVLSQRLFEIRPIYTANGKLQATSDGKTGVIERLSVGFLMSGLRLKDSLKSEESVLDFYDLKTIVLNLFTSLGTKGVRITALEERNRPALGDRYSLFHPGQTGFVRVGADNAGAFGAIHPEAQSRFKLKGKVFIAEFDVEVLIQYSRGPFDSVSVKAIPELPPMERDFALVVDTSVSADALISAALKTGKPLIQSVRVFDVYQGAQVGEGKKSIALRCLFQAPDRSLEETEVEVLSNKLIQVFQKETGAVLR